MPVNLARIVKLWSPKVGISEAAVRHYLTKNIHYELDSQALDGLKLFYRYAAECNVLPVAPELHFLETAQRIAG